jgi:hypothetical protein
MKVVMTALERSPVQKAQATIQPGRAGSLALLQVEVDYRAGAAGFESSGERARRPT